jgi:hypothetical protein
MCVTLLAHFILRKRTAMWVAALFYLLSIYVAPLHSLTSRNGIERCYYVEKVKTTRLDCSLMRRSVDSARPHQSMRRRRGWDTNPFEYEIFWLCMCMSGHFLYISCEGTCYASSFALCASFI